MSNYFIVRVNTEAHFSRPLAMADMAAIIERDGYWKKSSPVLMMEPGDPVIACGGHGGRGLFLHGIVRGKKWKKVKGGAEGSPAYRYKLAVQWDSTVYMHDPDFVNVVLKAAGIQGIPPILRAHSSIDLKCYREALAIVLKGQPVNPWEYEEEEQAA